MCNKYLNRIQTSWLVKLASSVMNVSPSTYSQKILGVRPGMKIDAELVKILTAVARFNVQIVKELTLTQISQSI